MVFWSKVFFQIDAFFFTNSNVIDHPELFIFVFDFIWEIFFKLLSSVSSNDRPL